jgi:hypothetical protein
MPQGTVYVLFWLDTEDYVTPEEDEAILRLCRIFRRRGVRGTFKLVGEKVRVLQQRGRTDVLAALREQGIGYHGDSHSHHPTISEYLANLDWDEGVVEFMRREGAGAMEVARLVRPPLCYGQGGGNWTPHAFGALRYWNVPAYVSGNSFVALNDEPFYFCGVLTCSRLGENALSIGFDIDDDDVLERLCADFLAQHERLRSAGGGLISIGMHPCTWVTAEFWDEHNFALGQNPLGDDYDPPPLKSPDRIARGYRNFAEFVDTVVEAEGVQVRPISDLLSVYRDDLAGRSFSRGEVVQLAQGLREGITFQPLAGGYVSAAEAFVLVTHALLYELHEGAPLEDLPWVCPLGPVRDVASALDAPTVPLYTFRRAALDAMAYLAYYNRLPSEVWLDRTRLSPADFLATAAAVLVAAAQGELPDPVRLQTGPVRFTDYVKPEYAEAAWKWPIFPRGFAAPKHLALTRLQAWTLKPAVRH